MDKKIKESIEQEINSNDVHLFMKGTPLFPQCGFSSTVVQILTYLEVPFTTTNVLDNEGIREGIKEFSNWPTIPQLYVKGELMGGCDIIKEMFENGELKEIFENENLLSWKFSFLNKTQLQDLAPFEQDKVPQKDLVFW